ncbi:MAG: hypothetical protein WDZ83_18395 [Rhizobiaceae bacterium]
MARRKSGRDRLTPWYIGLVLTIAAVLFVAYQTLRQDCGASPVLLAGVLAVIPVVYLTLMYLTFISQR